MPKPIPLVMSSKGYPLPLHLLKEVNEISGNDRLEDGEAAAMCVTEDMDRGVILGTIRVDHAKWPDGSPSGQVRYFIITPDLREKGA